MIMTTTMAKKSATKNTRKGLRQWPGKGNWEHKSITTMMARKRQPRTLKEGHIHGNGQQEHNQEQKRMSMTTMMARRNASKNTRRQPQ
jgi:hypothetical protein